jgi:hypothetical protein
MADERTYIKVHDGIEDHPKIMVLSDKAFRVLLTTWAWSSKHNTDGFVPEPVWTKRTTAKVRKELEPGLAHRPGHDCVRCPAVPDGQVRMHDYLEHQRSAEQIDEKKEAKKRAGALGNHNRWHLALGKHDPDCPICVANGSQVGSQNVSQRDRKTSPETETETDRKKGGTYQRNPPTARAIEPPPPRCSKHIDKPTDDPCRPCGLARREREAWDTANVADAARAETERIRVVRACQLCDADGRRWDPVSKARGTVGPCDHKPLARQEPA